MSQIPNTPAPPPPDDELQFDVVEPVAGAPAAVVAAPAVACVACGRGIADEYFAVNGKVICPECRARVEAPPPGRRPVRVAKAFVIGLGAAIAGAIVWFCVRYFLHLNMALVAIAVGFVVGKGVRFGSGNRGGRPYQVIAVLLTYISVTVNYMPDALGLMMKGHHTPHRTASTVNGRTAPDANRTAPDNSANAADDEADDDASTAEDDDGSTVQVKNMSPGVKALAFVAGVVLLFGKAATLPFTGYVTPISIAIIGFGLWEAWKLTAGGRLPITGPYRVSAGAPPPPGGGVAT